MLGGGQHGAGGLSERGHQAELAVRPAVAAVQPRTSLDDDVALDPAVDEGRAYPRRVGRIGQESNASAGHGRGRSLWCR